jgi:hypothetical protein
MMILSDLRQQATRALRRFVETARSQSISSLESLAVEALDRREAEWGKRDQGAQLIAFWHVGARTKGIRALRFAVFAVVFVHGFNSQPATGQVFITPPGTTCNGDTRLTSPVAGRMWCADSTTNTINGWNGAYWQSTAALSTGIVNVKDVGFGARGDGASDDTLALQTAVNATPIGGTVFFPPGNYRFSTLLLPRGITLQGAGWSVRANQTFGHSDWRSVSLNQGSILRSTATSGFALAFQSTSGVFMFHVRDLAIIGSGSGTSTGVGLGSESMASVMNHWNNVMIANFAVGLNLTNVQDSDFTSLRLRGNRTGIEFNTATNQNYFLNSEVQFATDGFKFVRCNTINFYGGLLQNNTNGIKFAPSTNGALEMLHFDGFWFERNGNHVHFDMTNGTLSGASFRNTRATVGTLLAYTGKKTINHLHFIQNQWGGQSAVLNSNVINATWIGNNVGSLTDNGFRTFIVDNGRMRHNAAVDFKRISLVYGRSVAIDAALANQFDITANDALDFTIANPANGIDGQRITITLRNTSGGNLGVVTWGPAYKLAQWTSPGSARSRSIDFRYDGTNWVEIARTPLDVPN